MTQEDFDRLAIFVAVVEELRREPFFSEDNSDSIGQSKRDGKEIVTGHFSHNVFLKSALQPFRKLWMANEHSSFRGSFGKPKHTTPGIRDLVFDWYDKNGFVERNSFENLEGYRAKYTGYFDARLKDPAWESPKEKDDKSPFSKLNVQESIEDVIDIWVYTQVAHTGKSGSMGRFALKDFKDWNDRIGRELFEFAFRSSVSLVGSFYQSFGEKLALPLYEQLKVAGMVPGFEAECALQFSPYYDVKHNIVYDDPFWHLEREAPGETLDRVFKRGSFSAARSLLRGLYPKKSEAIQAFERHETMSELLEASGFIEIAEQDGNFATCFSVIDPMTGSSVYFSVECRPQKPKTYWFANDSKSVLAPVYAESRRVYLDARSKQRPLPNSDQWGSSS